MTEYELLQLQNEYKEALGVNIMNFISILSGYLLASHYLGSNITKVQFAIMTLTYTIVMLVAAASAITNYGEFFVVEEFLEQKGRLWESQNLPVLGGEKVQKYVIAGALLVSYIGSLVFALTARKRLDEKA